MLTAEQRQMLIRAALGARQQSYAPYSHYPVGAALLSASGKVYTGVNVENAVYNMGVCAERVAIFKAVSEGEKEFLAVAVVTANGGTPCGACRQVLAEFGLETIVLVADASGRLVLESTVAGLLPGSFGPADLKEDT